MRLVDSVKPVAAAVATDKKRLLLTSCSDAMRPMVIILLQDVANIFYCSPPFYDKIGFGDQGVQ